VYYVNREQLELRLQCIPSIAEAMREIGAGWNGSKVEGLAQERALHLAIETVTDVGSYLIDGFIMRDASSYEDIIEINAEEQVFPRELTPVLIELVRLRKPLVQEYYAWPSLERHPFLAVLPDVLETFASSVRQYVERELGAFHT